LKPSLEREAAERLLSAYRGFYLSKREGLTIVKADVNGKTVIVWLRKSPVTPKALDLFWRTVEGHRYDELVLCKLVPTADMPTFEELKKFRIVSSVEEIR